MSEIAIRTNEHAEIGVGESDLEKLGRSLNGELLLPDEAGYDGARAVWNAMIERRPAVIARCVDAHDVREAVRFAARRGLLLSVRGGGHHIAGNAVCEGGLMIDLSPMTSVEVDTDEQTARVGPGATLADFDEATQEHGLATPVGINSTTGIAGLTLGGGFGWLSTRHGLTVDNLISADVVTADGEQLTAISDENADLFWGLRGAGANFGVVTSFEFRLHPVGPDVLAGLIVHPFEAAEEVLGHYREFVADVPDELTVWFVLRKAPPLPFLPEDVHGKEIVIFPAFYSGDMKEGERLLEPLRKVGQPIADVIGPHKYVAWQSAFDPLLTPGARNYWKSHNFTSLPDGALEKMRESAGRLPSPESEIFVGKLGGAAARVPADATAYPHRDAEFVMNVHTRWQDAADDERCVTWAREFYGQTAPFATGGTYVNFQTEDEMAKAGSAYGPNYDRLVELKRRYDPENLFRVNQNIRPSAKA